jgi:hypothetical protein
MEENTELAIGKEDDQRNWGRYKFTTEGTFFRFQRQILASIFEAQHDHPLRELIQACA